MEYLALQIVMTACLQAIYVRAVMLALRLRSNAIYMVAAITDFAIATTLKALNIHPLFNALLGMAFYITAPIILSIGDLKSRIARSCSLYLILNLTDMLGTVVYALMGDITIVFDHIGADNAYAVTATYIVIMLTSGIAFESLLARFERADGDFYTFLSPSVFVIILASFLFFNAYYAKLIDLSHSSLHSESLLILFMFCFVTLVIVYLILWSVRREAEAIREATEHTFVLRKTKHTRSEVEPIARRAEGMRLLRHDLASQYRAIHRLAEEGNRDEATSLLSGLRAKTRVLGSEIHE